MSLPWAHASPPALTYQGRIVKTDGKPLEHTSVSFQFEITTPNGGCVLYREQVNGINMANSNGIFDVKIGQAHSYPAAAGFSILDSFNNSTAVTCDGGAAYNPVLSDGRLLRVQFHDGTAWRLISPDSVIRSVPFAGYSESSNKLGSYQASDFILKNEVNGNTSCDGGSFLTWNATTDTFGCASGGAGSGSVTDVTSANSYLAVTNTSTTPLLTINVGTTAGTLAAGNDSRFTNSRAPNGSASGDLSGTYPAPTVSKIHGVGIDFSSAPSNGQVLTFNGTNWVSSHLPAGNAGTLTSITAGTGLTGGSITSSGTIGLGTELTGLNSLSSTGFVRRTGAGTYGTTAASTLASINTLVQRDGSGVSGFSGVSLSDGATGLVTLQTAAISATYSLKLPDAQGAANQVMINDGSGLLSWSNVPSAPGAACGSGNVLTYNGSAFTCVPDQVGSAGGGIVSINSQTGSAQSFGNGTTGNSPGWSSAADVHTLNIPYARNSSVTAGLISKSEYDTFNGKQAALGFTPLNPANNLSDVASATTARTNLGLGTAATYTAATTTTAASGEVVLGNDTRLANSRAPSGTAGGDLAGSYPNPDVNRIKGVALSYTSLTSGQFLKYNGSQWANADLAVSDISGLSTSIAGKVDKTQIAGCTAKQTLYYVSASDTWSCANIGIDDSQITYASKSAKTFLAAPTGAAGVPTFRTIASTDLPATVTDGLWTASSGNVNRATGRVGVGVASPEGALHVVTSGVAVAMEDDVLIEGYSDTTSAAYSTRRARGTLASPTAVQAGDALGGIYNFAYNGSAFIASGAVHSGAETNYTTTASTQNSYVAVRTTAAGSQTEKVRITSAGYMGIGTTAPAAPLQVKAGLFLGEGNGDSSVGPDIRFGNAGVIAAEDAFYINIDGTNSGSGDFVIGKGSLTTTATPLFTIGNSGNAALGGTVSTANLLTIERKATSGATRALQLSIPEYLNTDGLQGISVSAYPRFTTSGTYGFATGYLYAAPTVNAGATNSGLMAGLTVNMRRNNTGSTSVNDNGTLSVLRGLNIIYGHAADNSSATPGTTTVYGAYLDGTNLSGTMGTHYGLYIKALGAAQPTTANYGVYAADALANNYFAGSIGIGTTAPTVPLQVISGGSDISLSGGGYIVAGLTTSANIGIDNNEIMARNNGVASSLYVQADGGDLVVGGTNFVAKETGLVGMGTASPAVQLHVYTATAGATVARFQSGTGSCNVVPNTGMTCSSDERLKEDIKPIPYALDKINQVQGVTFKWKERATDDQSRHMGFIAQDIEKIAPELVGEDDRGFKQVNYANFVAILTQAMKEFFAKWSEDSKDLHQKVEKLQGENGTQSRELASVKEELAQEKRRNDLLEKRLEALEKSQMAK